MGGESLIDATRITLKALREDPDKLESIWRSSATKDQINDMTELLNLAMATPDERRRYEESARWAEDMAASASAGSGYAPQR